LLIRGQFDLVCNPEQTRAFEESVPNGKVEIFENSGHFARFEEADRYAKTVTDFLKK
jgi:pimeloyl-ACP methyl ester carboxylesterase